MKRHDALGWAAIWSARLYRALLLAFPAPFRRAYGDEMARTFRDLCREAWRTGGAGGVLALWPGALRDLLLAASAEHVGGLTMLRLTLILSLAALVLFALDTLVELVWPVPSGDPPDFMTNVAIYGFVAWLGLAVVVWLLGAFVAARQGRWGWFALALCLPYAGSLVYSVLGPVAAPRVARAQDAEFERRNAASNIDPAALEQGMVIMTRWVLILSLAAPGLYVLDDIIYYAGAFIVGKALHTYNLQTYDQVMGYTVWIPAIAAVGAWLLGIVDALRRGMWGWFILVLLVPVLGSLIYSAVTLRARQPDIA